jgi:RNA polymerase sigma factor (sigma-70 family)
VLNPPPFIISDDVLAESRGLIVRYIRAIDWSNGVFDNSGTDDIAQAVLQRAVERRHAFVGVSAGEFSNWLLAITRTVMVDGFRRHNAAKRKATLVTLPDVVDSNGRCHAVDDLAGDCSTPSVKFQRLEQIENLFRAMDSLPEDERTVVTRRYLCGSSLSELCEVLNQRSTEREPRSMKAVASLLERALRRLRKEFNRLEGDCGTS